ncbi:hypothetical protein SAMN05444338_10174 [Flavobacterium degerlachei]|jgi:hypothetical protein|uniref:Uncharacterized protein n=1 Tax=Flavobacterium degerlachei TaxID=229203 RepID=A0A1H2Q2Z1_9FLAO|nr:hypothetical protein SAMN05444338_10174 [Flavobacterium degerlachei]
MIIDKESELTFFISNFGYNQKKRFEINRNVLNIRRQKNKFLLR